MPSNNPNSYYMLASAKTTIENNEVLTLPDDLALKVRPGDGILIGTWQESSQTGVVNGLVVIKSFDVNKRRAEIEYAGTDITLRPLRNGRRWWHNDHFNFAQSVRERYMLDDIFAEHFPQYAELNIKPLRQPTVSQEKSYIATAGYIYVLQSEYGYKIGKTVNLKDRMRLFGVKLPFKFELIITGLVDNYSKTEAELHRQYAEKRLEGEWFDLTASDLDKIQQYLSSPS